MKSAVHSPVACSLVRADHQPREQLADATPNSRIDLDVERRTNQHHQKSCFELFHWECMITKHIGCQQYFRIVRYCCRARYDEPKLSRKEERMLRSHFRTKLIPTPGGGRNCGSGVPEGVGSSTVLGAGRGTLGLGCACCASRALAAQARKTLFIIKRTKNFIQPVFLVSCIRTRTQ